MKEPTEKKLNSIDRKNEKADAENEESGDSFDDEGEKGKKQSDNSKGKILNFNKNVTIADLKSKLKIVTGGSSDNMKVDVLDKNDRLVCSLDSDTRQLGSYTLDDGNRMQLLITGTSKIFLFEFSLSDDTIETEQVDDDEEQCPDCETKYPNVTEMEKHWNSSLKLVLLTFL